MSKEQRATRTSVADIWHAQFGAFGSVIKGHVATDRMLTREVVSELIHRILDVAKGSGSTNISIHGWWNGEMRWARNRVSLASDRRDLRIEITRTIAASSGSATTNQVDSTSIEAAVRAAERMALALPRQALEGMEIPWDDYPIPQTTVWSDATYAVTAAQRAAVAQRLTEGAEGKTMLSAGYIEMRAGAVARYFSGPQRMEPWPVKTLHYTPYTQAQCSMTVRHPKGIGSGWAGLSGSDWGKIDGAGLAQRALDKCLTSLNPVAIEPGRYTTILEPQAVGDFVLRLCTSLDLSSSRYASESPYGHPMHLGPDAALSLYRSKLGLKIVDERITLSHVPTDPKLGVLPVPGLAPVTWIKDGILTDLSNEWRYTHQALRSADLTVERRAYHMSGGDTSIDEMIATTQRGILVTRFSGLDEIDVYSGLCTGVTRDGLWLIEDGKIAKAIKNFRIAEAPLFILNQVEALGVPTPVFRPVGNPYTAALTPAIVPALKVRDFSFIAMVDAV